MFFPGWTVTALIILLNAKLALDALLPDAWPRILYGALHLPPPS